MIAFALFSTARAFCGAYAGSADQDLPANSRSDAILVRNGSTTTLTLAADIEGDVTDFALLLPVPAILTADDVQLADEALIETVKTYGTPRAVVYTCEDALEVDLPYGLPVGCTGSFGCATESDSGLGLPGPQADSSVVVESAFTVGNYELVVLSAEESHDLWTWLDQNGYALPPSGAGVLQEYIDQGVYFLAAKVALDAAPEAGMWLSPLQLTYEAEAFSLPIRIGTISAAGEQEVMLHVFAPEEFGQAGIANVEQVELDHECMWPADVADFSEWYNTRLGEHIGGEHGIRWLREHSWPVLSYAQDYHCDPCTPSGDFTQEQLAGLGASPDWFDVHYTRLRVRYLPQDAAEDLVLYFDGQRDVKDQARFIAYDHSLEFLFPICDQGWAEDPGECEGSRTSADPRVTGCAAYQGPIGLIGALAALLVRRRRR